jgi:benzoate-CoA ligase
MTCENYAQYLFELNNTRSDHTALIDECNALTYAQMQDKVRSFASVLRTHNFAPQSRVILYFDDCVEWPVAFLALIAVGLNPVCVNHNNTPEQLKYLVDLVDARAVITNKTLTLKKSIAVIEASQVLEHTGSDFFEFYKFHPDEPCFWLLTSGTTGHPKAIVHRHQNLINYANIPKDFWNISSGTRIFSTAKLSFAYGLSVNMCLSLASGSTSYFLHGVPAPKRIIDLVRKNSIEKIFTVPTIINSIIKHIPDNNLNDSVKEIVSAGEALPAVISKKFRDKFGLHVRNSFGMSELTSICLIQSINNYQDGSIGKPLPGVACKVVDPDLAEVLAGEVGELYVKSEYTASLYWKDWKYSQHTFVGDWLRTGDKVKKLTDGNFEYVSRATDQIKINGQFVSATEVESCLLELRDIQDCVVVFRVAQDSLPEIHAFVVCENKNYNKKDFIDFLSTKLPIYKIPKHYHMIENIPKTLTNKKMRYELLNRLTNEQTTK